MIGITICIVKQKRLKMFWQTLKQFHVKVAFACLETNEVEHWWK